MKNYTLEDIRKLKHCYDPADVLPADWQGTIVDGLRLEHIPPKDRLYIAMQLIPDHTARLFAVWCARQALALIDSPDPRSLAACDVAERYANGNATDEDLKAAYVAAYAAYVAADTAAHTAAYAATTYAAHTAAYAATAYAAHATAYAAHAAAYAAHAAYVAAHAAYVAADAAADTAATYAATREEQIGHLVEMLEVAE